MTISHTEADNGTGVAAQREANVLQFGTGVLVRGFFDWMLQQARDASKWEGSAIGVKLTAEGTLSLAQAASHPHTTRGVLDGSRIEKHGDISVVEKWLNPYEPAGLHDFLESARLPALRVVVSNSTEAGIAYEQTDKPAEGSCPNSFPAKLLMWLHARFAADAGLKVTVLPLELVEDNGQKLKEIVKRHANDWALGSNFAEWLDQNCDFRNTLVDRIVTKPGAEDDPLLTISEPYHLLAIEGDSALEEILPLQASGSNVVYTSNLGHYRTRKVRVLNGAHHTMTFLGLEMGKKNVLEVMKDPVLGRFVQQTIRSEVLPILPGDAQDLRSYNDAIFERFANPWLDHRLEAIAMNSSAKVLVRLIPSICDYVTLFGELPAGLVLAVAAFLSYTGPVKGCEKEPVIEACRTVAGLTEAVNDAAAKLKADGAASCMSSILSKYEADMKTGSDFDAKPAVKSLQETHGLPAQMRQCLLQEPGKFVFTEVDVPKSVEPGWAIIRVGAVGMCGTDYHAYHGRQNFFTYPRVLGHEIGATVVAVGDGSLDSPVKVGDRCAVVPYWGCCSCVACNRGKPNCCAKISVIGVHAHGAMQQYLAVPIDKLVASEKLSLEQLALVETLCIGAHAVARGQAGSENVLVIGAGPIGMATAQFAKAEGAEVAVMDINESRLEFVRKAAGIDLTLNSLSADDLPEAVAGLFGGELPTLVFDATGNLMSMQGAFKLAGHGGRVVFVGHTKDTIKYDNPLFHARELSICASRNALASDFRRVVDLIEAGKVDVTPWITHRCDLDTFEQNFLEWMMPDSGVIKGIVQMEDSSHKGGKTDEVADTASGATNPKGYAGA